MRNLITAFLLLAVAIVAVAYLLRDELPQDPFVWIEAEIARRSGGNPADAPGPSRDTVSSAPRAIAGQPAPPTPSSPAAPSTPAVAAAPSDRMAAPDEATGSAARSADLGLETSSGAPAASTTTSAATPPAVVSAPTSDPNAPPAAPEALAGRALLPLERLAGPVLIPPRASLARHQLAPPGGPEERRVAERRRGAGLERPPTQLEGAARRASAPLTDRGVQEPPAARVGPTGRPRVIVAGRADAPPAAPAPVPVAAPGPVATPDPAAAPGPAATLDPSTLR